LGEKYDIPINDQATGMILKARNAVQTRVEGQIDTQMANQIDSRFANF
jgi:hypothetical protein